MAIQAINIAEVNSAAGKKKHASNGVSSNQPSFQGLEQIPVAVADALYNGGFITSFIAQDFFGMAGPRVLEGINRRPVNKETGKKEGPYNWAFARREGIREILSGPSAFVIPAIILHFVKKYSGKANNVPINMIQGLGNNFIEYAANNPNTLDNVAKTRREFYDMLGKNILETTFHGQQISAEDIEKFDFTNRVIEIEQAKKKPLWKVIADKKVAGSKQDLTESLLDDFMRLKKKYLNPSVNEYSVELNINPKKIGKTGVELTEADKTGVDFKKLLKTMNDFTDDVIETTGDALKKYQNNEFDPKRFLKTFVDKRTGSRILCNVGMWAAVVVFYALIPKLYSIGLKGKNPAFIHEQKAPEDAKGNAALQSGSTENKKDIAFGSRERFFTSTAEAVLDSAKWKKFLNHFEFDDASMSVSAMMALLYGFCLPTRLLNAPDKYDRYETYTRDITSFGAILFAAKALSRGFSKIFAKVSGLALNITPADHNKNFYTKYIRDFFSPISGINVLSNKELASKYTNVHAYRDGILGFFDFVTENGGNLKKMLQMDKTVAENAKIILGKDLKDAANDDEIKNAFKNITEEGAKKAKTIIENIFKDSQNKFVKNGKIYNSLFTCLSTIALVPLFMVWLARTCDKLTRNAREKDLALQAKEKMNTNVITNTIKAKQVTMQGFLANK